MNVKTWADHPKVKTLKRERQIFYGGCLVLVLAILPALSIISFGLNYWETAEKCERCATDTCEACQRVAELDAFESTADFKALYIYRRLHAFGILIYIILTVRFSMKLNLHWSLKWIVYPTCAWIYFIVWLVPFIMLYFHSKWAMENLASTRTEPLKSVRAN